MNWEPSDIAIDSDDFGQAIIILKNTGKEEGWPEFIRAVVPALRQRLRAPGPLVPMTDEGFQELKELACVAWREHCEGK